MISGLRGHRPAGGLCQRLSAHPPANGELGFQGGDATHAWVSLWCGEAAGWVGFDPTNGVTTRDDHIVLAVGRDYADVAPIDGVLLGPGVQALEVEVRVTAEG